YMAISKYGQVNIGLLNGVTTKVHRGDLVVPINASGNIKPASVTPIKSKASGEVQEPPPEAGTMVVKGQVVVQLDPVDETNSRDRARSDLRRAEIALENAKIAKRQKEQALLPGMKAKLRSAQARAN